MRRAAIATFVLATGLALAVADPPTAPAAEPGLAVPLSSEAGDQRRGNVLFFNFFGSKANTAREETRVSITNHSEQSANFIRLFFVQGSTGLVASSFICLTATQTASFQASDVLPGFRGMLIAVSVDGVLGCPAGDSGAQQNRLSGQAQVKTGKFQGTLPAVAATALFNGSLPGCDSNSVEVTLPFNGVQYSRLPRTLQIDNIGSRADGNQTLLVLNRIGGDLAGGLGAIGTVNGTLFNGSGTDFAYSTTTGNTQLYKPLSNKFPVTSPVFNSIIPAGTTGWTKFANGSDVPMLGAAFFRPGGAVNLRVRTLSTTGALVFPVESPSC